MVWNFCCDTRLPTLSGLCRDAGRRKERLENVIRKQSSARRELNEAADSLHQFVCDQTRDRGPQIFDGLISEGCRNLSQVQTPVQTQ